MASDVGQRASGVNAGAAERRACARCAEALTSSTVFTATPKGTLTPLAAISCAPWYCAREEKNTRDGAQKFERRRDAAGSLASRAGNFSQTSCRLSRRTNWRAAIEGAPNRRAFRDCERGGTEQRARQRRWSAGKTTRRGERLSPELSCSRVMMMTRSTSHTSPWPERAPCWAVL